MRVGLSTTTLCSDKHLGQLDGIGVYTQQIFQGLQSKDINLQAYNFSNKSKEEGGIYLGGFAAQLILSGVSNCPLLSSSKIDRNVDIFHATDHYIPKLRKTPVVATIMDAIPLAHPEWVTDKHRKLKNWLFKKSAHWAEHIITISEFSADTIAEQFEIPRTRISVVPLGVDEQYKVKLSEEIKKAVLARYQLPDKYFLCIGTLQPRKNIERVINAFLQLPVTIQENHPLVIVGRHGWECDALVERLLQLSKSKQNIRWLNYVSSTDKYALLQASQALVFASLYEGFGLPILEAFASNVPVITSNITAMPEVAGDAAVLVDPYSEGEISEAMLSLVTDQGMVEKLQIKGKLRLAEFSWTKAVEQTINIYSKLI